MASQPKSTLPPAPSTPGPAASPAIADKSSQTHKVAAAKKPKTKAKMAPHANKAAPTAKPAKSEKAAKPVKTSKPEKAAKPLKPVTEKAKKPKLIRDSFTMPKDEYEQIAMLKLSLAKQGRTAKKSELLRAGLMLLSKQSASALLTCVEALTPIKTGRPRKD